MDYIMPFNVDFKGSEPAADFGDYEEPKPEQQPGLAVYIGSEPAADFGDYEEPKPEQQPGLAVYIVPQLLQLYREAVYIVPLLLLSRSDPAVHSESIAEGSKCYPEEYVESLYPPEYVVPQLIVSRSDPAVYNESIPEESKPYPEEYVESPYPPEYVVPQLIVSRSDPAVYNAQDFYQIENSGTTINFIDHSTIIYRNEFMEWNFEDHNFGMIFQPESLPANIANTTVEISVTCGKDYVLPKDTVPVSAFFSIECQHKFHKNVLVSVEHYAAEKCDLSFVISSNSQHPFQFELLNGGEFIKRYGLIERKEFCIIGIVTRILTGRWPKMDYYFALYATPPLNYIWNIFVYIMEYSNTNKYRIKENTKDLDLIKNTHTCGTVTHNVDYFIIDISLNDDEVLHGWQLLQNNINPIKIQRRRIDECREVPPPATFKIKLDVSKTSSTLLDLAHNYKIEDIEQENSLTLNLIAPQKSTGKTVPDCSTSRGDEETAGSDQHFPDEKIAYAVSKDPCHPLKLNRSSEYPDGRGVRIAIIDKYEEQTSKKYHQALLNNGRLKFTLMDAYTKSDEVQEIHPDENKKVVISNHALQCTAIAVGEEVEGTFVYKNKCRACKFPGGVAPKAHATLYLVKTNYSKNSVALALTDIAKKNFHVLSMSFGSLEKCKNEEELKIILQGTPTIVVVAAGNRGDAAISCTAELIYKPEFRARNLISVGGYNCFNKIAIYSPTNEKYVTTFQICEFFAPFSDDNPTSLEFTAGTSMSTPAVAGIICLLIQIGKKHGIDSLSKSEIICLLKNVIKEKGVPIRDGCYYQEFIKNVFKDRILFQKSCK